MLSDYLELPQVKFLIEHWMGISIIFILFAIVLYFTMLKKDEVKITDHSLVKGDEVVNVTRKHNGLTYLVEGLSAKPREFQSLVDAETYYSKFELLDATTYGDRGRNIRRYIIGDRIS